MNIWIDRGGIDGAALWGESIVRALEGAKVLLLMVSPSAVSSHNVAKEVMLTSERKGNILPVHLEPTTIPLSLKSVSYTHLRAHETPEHLVCRLLLEKKKSTSKLLLFALRPPQHTYSISYPPALQHHTY